MPEITITAVDNGAGEYIDSSDAVYSNAIDGLGGFSVEDFYGVGQLKSTNYNCFLGFIEFDTSVLQSNITILSVDLKLSIIVKSTAGSEFTIQARPYEFALPLTSASWRTAAQVATDTPILATLDTTGKSSNTYYSCTEGADFKYNIQTNKSTKIYLISDRTVAQTTPTSAEWALVDSNFGTKPPTLTINYITSSDFGTNF